MIAPSAIKAFINRELDSFDDLKKLPSKTLDKECAEIIKTVGSKTKPMGHQKVCLLIGTAFLRFLFLLDMGTGKSKIALDLLQYHKRTGVIHKPSLVLVPNKANIQVWIDEANKHHPHLNVCDFHDVDQLQDEKDVDIFVSLYVRVSRFVCKGGSAGGGGNKWTIDYNYLKDFADNFDAMILDESTAIKNSQSIVHKVVNKISDSVISCYALTGTPHGRDAQDLWGQFKVVDKGETLGPTLGLFREAFFRKVQTRVIYHKRRRIPIYNYFLTKESTVLLNKTIKHRSIRYETDECLSLPSVTHNLIRFIPSSGATDQYNRLMEGVQQQDKETLSKTFTTMRQILSGFSYIRPTDEERQVLHFDKVNERLVTLLSIVENIPSHSKFVVFHDFIHSGDAIQELFKEEKIKHERVFSGTKDMKKVLKNFNDNDKCRAIIINNASGAFGLNLQVANYAIFYESPVSPIVRSQAEKRIHRAGQEKKVFYYDIVATYGVDLRIREMIMQGKNLLEEIINGRQVL